MSVDVGQEAPVFTLKNQFGEDVTLSDYRGEKNVLLVFYPKAFTGICTGELCDLRDRAVDFANDDTQVIGVSCDSDAALRAFGEQEGLSYPLLSDFWPHGAVASQYGVFFADRGIALRATFVIDKQGVVRWKVVNQPGDARNSDDYKAALAAL